MNRDNRRIALFVLFLAALLVLRLSGAADYITFENLKKHRDILRDYVGRHYALSVALYITLFMSTAFFVPGAIILTLAGGFLFGVLGGTIYANIGGTIGATLAFLAARHLAGGWVQHRYYVQLQRFNEELSRNGYLYLLALRIIPVLPFFVVNFLAGLTRLPLRTFVWTTYAGMLPGAVVYTYAGSRLRFINTAGDMFSAEVIAALILLALFILLPLFLKYIKKIG